MPGPKVHLNPPSVESGETVEVGIEGIPHEFAGRAGEVIVVGVDRIETYWNASLGGVVTDHGSFLAKWQPSLIDETVLEVSTLKLPAADGDGERLWDLSGQLHGRCVVGGSDKEWTPDELAARLHEFRLEQASRFEGPIGDPAAPNNHEHRALCVIERLRSTRQLKLPGASLMPLTFGNPGSGEPELIDAILGHLGWPSRVDKPWWSQHSADGRPWTGILIGPIFAADHNAAAKLAWDLRDRVTDILALTRGSSPRPLVTVVEQRQDPTGVQWRIYHEDERYTGNLIGGFIAGEDQRELLLGDAAMSADPLLALAVRLFRDAQAEKVLDAAYFRYWGLLETLSGARFPPPHSPVVLLDGSTWLGTHNTTEYPAPRVYALLARHMSAGEQTSSVAPAANLYEAVRVWYARRNATAHYGRFDPGEAVQRSKPWFKWAVKTMNTNGGGPLGDPWLWSLQQMAARILRRELGAVGRANV